MVRTQGHDTVGRDGRVQGLQPRWYGLRVVRMFLLLFSLSPIGYITPVCFCTFIIGSSYSVFTRFTLLLPSVPFHSDPVRVIFRYVVLGMCMYLNQSLLYEGKGHPQRLNYTYLHESIRESKFLYYLSV